MSARLLQHQHTPMRSVGVSSNNSLLCRNSGRLHRRRMLSDTLSNFRCAAALVLLLLLARVLLPRPGLSPVPCQLTA